MIAKGKCRAAPAQLAGYLLRVHTRDGEQRVEVLELQSGTDSLRETFLDWHSVGLGTRGEKTLYHAQISPDPRYKMTPEQYLHAADILGEELGLQNHPRVVVLHDDGEQPHLHIVWQRADVETMTMWDDGNNYRKHEQASLRMELEFGQAIVPGKHAKRDREQQPEFPRAESTQDEQKQAQRTDMTFDERKEQITALRQSADNAQAFKNALEETGYVLAKGDRRGFVVVDEEGEVFSLSKHVGDLKDKAFKEFMSPIDRDQLPSVDEAKAQQQDRALSARQQAQETAAEKQPPPAPLPEEQQPKRTGEALRALKAQLAAMKADAGSPQAFAAAVEKAGYVLASGDRGYTVVDENGGAYNLARQLKLKLAEVNEFMAPIDLKTLPSVDEAKALQRDRALNAEKPAPEASKFLSPELAEKIEPPAPAPAKAEEPRSAEDSTAPPSPAPPVPPPLDPELEALKKAIAESQAKDAQKWADFNALELRQLEYDLTRMNAGKEEDFDAIQAVEMKALRDRQKERRTGIKGFLDAMQSKLNPTLAAEKAKERSREVAQLKARQAKERKDYLALIEQTKQLEIENLQERHALQRSVREHKNEDDQERFIKEHHDAKRILAEIEAQRIKDGLKHNDSLRDGPPPPKMGK